MRSLGHPVKTWSYALETFNPFLPVKNNHLRTLIVLCLLFSALFTGFASAETATSGVIIGVIKVAGNRSIETSEILATIRSRVGNSFEPGTAAEDAKRIAQLQGVEWSYYNTEVVEGRVQLTFVVVERNLLRSITFIGNKKYKSKKLRKKLGLKIGDYLDPFVASDGAEKLTAYYQKKGFAFVEIKLDKEKLRQGRLVYAVREGPRTKIMSVKFSGNEKIKTKAIKKVVKSRKKKFFFWPRYYNREAIAKDTTKLESVYYERGFLNNKVRAKPQFNATKTKVDIIFLIEEGPAYTVEQVIVGGNEYFADEELRAEMKLAPGQICNTKKMESDLKRILKLYRQSGFVDAKVEQRRSFISDDKVNINFDVTQGRRFRIGKINITGNEETRDRVIRRVLDEYDFQPGQWYNADMARGDGRGYLEKLVRRTVLSESATITPTSTDGDKKNAQVNIVEGQTGMVMLGAGVASDIGIIGQIIFEQKNFDIKDKPKSFKEFITGNAFKGAGQNLRITLAPGTELSRYSVSFTEPYLYNKPMSLDVVAESFSWIREAYDEKRVRGYVGLEKRYKNRWRRSVGFRAENVKVADLDSDAPQEVIDDKGDNTLVGLMLGLGKDMTDDRFYPTKGYSYNVSYEQVGGDHTFGILKGVYRRYRTLYEDLAERKTVLSTKLSAATVIGDAPVFEKFYAGGMGTYGIRGFDYRGISPRGMQTGGVVNPERKDPIGSDWIFLANAEVSVPLVGETLSMIYFVDSGMVSTGGYRASIGVGVQIMLPQWFGPIPMKFTLAAPFMKSGDDETQVFNFSMGRLF